MRLILVSHAVPKLRRYHAGVISMLRNLDKDVRYALASRRVSAS